MHIGMREWAGPKNGETAEFNASKLRADLRTLAGDMEQLLKATASQTGRQIDQVRARAEESLKTARGRIADAQETAFARACAAGKAANTYVRDNPWQVLAVVAAVGLVLGFFLARPADTETS